MPTERKCTQCGNNGHNSRTCTGCKKFKLFGVQIDVRDAKMRKCYSAGNLEAQGTIVEASDYTGNMKAEDSVDEVVDYTSDGILGRHGRKKGTPWTVDEHKAFLAGLEKIGKGDWKGISKNYVPSRTSSQVASHAQKYFIRLAAQKKKRRRASVFDIPLKEENQQPQAGSTSVSKFDQKFQEGCNLTVPLTKIIGESKAQDIRAPVSTFVMAPPPMTIWNESDLQYMAYIRDRYTQGSIQRFVPTRLLTVPCPVSYFSVPNIQPPVTKMQQGSSQDSSINYKNFFASEIPPNFSFVKSQAGSIR